MTTMRESLRRLLLAGVLCLLAAAAFAAYDPTPAPVDADPAEVTAKLNAQKNSLFFLGHMFDSADVQFDAFLIPNGSYAMLDCKWARLVSTAGKNILRQPTAEEKEQDEHFHHARIYTADRKADVSHAEGKITVTVPCTFARVEFAANEAGATKTADPITVTLNRCKGSSASLTMKGAGAVEPLVILYDATGRRLQMDSRSYTTDPDADREMNYRMQGAIAKIEVYYPTQYATATLNVVVPAEPDVMNSDAPIKTARYLPPSTPVEGATLDENTLKAQTGLALRSDGDGIPELVLNMPHVLNSAFARVDFGKPKTVDANGKDVIFHPMSGIYRDALFMDGIRFNGPPTGFARASGSVKLRYPGTVKTVILTTAKPRDGGLTARFSGARVAVAGLPERDFDDFSFDDPELVHAYDATGGELKKLNFSGSEYRNDVNWTVNAFWGTPTAVRITVVENWLTLTLPYDLALVKEPVK